MMMVIIKMEIMVIVMMMVIQVYKARVCTHTASLMMMIPVVAPDRHIAARKTVTFPVTC